MKIKQTEWFQKLNQHEHVLIFGAGAGALLTYTWLKQMNVDPECFLVSERWDNPLCLKQKLVKTFQEIDGELKQNALVVISQKYEDNDEMRKVLQQAGFKNMVPSILQNTSAITRELQTYRQSVLGSMKVSSPILEMSCRANSDLVNLCIYAVTSDKNLHKSRQQYQSDYITYIQAGAKCTDVRVCDLTDDSGENISDLNPWYCELTAGYWISKNDFVHDYIGLYHYSRGLSLSDGQLEIIVKEKVDVVLPIPHVWKYEMRSVCFLYTDLVLDAIRRVSPEYVASAELFFSKKIFFAGNIVLARSEIYTKYYNWMFRVLQECERIHRGGKAQVRPRTWGYCGEILTSIYFIHNRKNYQIVFSAMRDLY